MFLVLLLVLDTGHQILDTVTGHPSLRSFGAMEIGCPCSQAWETGRVQGADSCLQGWILRVTGIYHFISD